MQHAHSNDPRAVAQHPGWLDSRSLTKTGPQGLAALSRLLPEPCSTEPGTFFKESVQVYPYRGLLHLQVMHTSARRLQQQHMYSSRKCFDE
jgi:hypothetical protein